MNRYLVRILVWTLLVFAISIYAEGISEEKVELGFCVDYVQPVGEGFTDWKGFPFAGLFVSLPVSLNEKLRIDFSVEGGQFGNKKDPAITVEGLSLGLDAKYRIRFKKAIDGIYTVVGFSDFLLYKGTGELYSMTDYSLKDAPLDNSFGMNFGVEFYKSFGKLNFSIPAMYSFILSKPNNFTTLSFGLKASMSLGRGGKK